MTHVTCRLTAENRDQLGTLRSESRMGYVYLFSCTGREAGRAREARELFVRQRGGGSCFLALMELDALGHGV